MVTFLDEKSRHQWSLYTTGNKEPPHYERVMAFLTERIQDMVGEFPTSPAQSSKSRPSHPSKPSKAYHTRSSNSGLPCIVCSEEGHRLHQCSTFKEWTVPQWKQHVRIRRIWYNCFVSGYNSSKCNNRGSCRECRAVHYTLLHTDNTPHPAPKALAYLISSSDKLKIPTRSFVRTALVDVRTDSIFQVARVLFDEGAEISMITRRFVNNLKAKLIPHPLRVEGIGPGSVHCKHITVVEMGSLHNEKHKPVVVNCHIVDNPISVDISADFVRLQHEMTVRNFSTWADPHPWKSAKADLFLSATDGQHCLVGQECFSVNIYLRFIHTIFGWTALGTTPTSETPATMFKMSVVAEESADKLLKKLWELQAIPEKDIPLTSDKQSAVA